MHHNSYPELTQLTQILARVLGLDTSGFDESTPLLGAIPEFDSMALMTLLVELEANFALDINSSDLTAEQFATVGSLHSLVSPNN